MEVKLIGAGSYRVGRVLCEQNVITEVDAQAFEALDDNVKELFVTSWPAAPATGTPLIVACTDETTVMDEIAGTSPVLSFRFPKAGTIIGLRASLNVASSDGDVTLTVAADELEDELTIAEGFVVCDLVAVEREVDEFATITVTVNTPGVDAAGLKVYFYYRES